jgi:hypothetical protein
VFYLLYFQEPGLAEAELERDVRETFLKILGGGSVASGAREKSDSGPVGMVPRDGGLLSGRPIPTTLPDWLTEADIDFYVREFGRTGLRGGLNWYRNIDRNWGLLAPLEGEKVTVPALYMVGDRDLIMAFPGMDRAIANRPACPLSVMCGRLRVGKDFLHVAGLVGAAMCSAFTSGSHDRWP